MVCLPSSFRRLLFWSAATAEGLPCSGELMLLWRKPLPLQRRRQWSWLRDFGTPSTESTGLSEGCIGMYRCFDHVLPWILAYACVASPYLHWSRFAHPSGPPAFCGICAFPFYLFPGLTCAGVSVQLSGLFISWMAGRHYLADGLVFSDLQLLLSLANFW